MKHNIEIAPLLDYYVIAIKDKETGKLVETFTLNESGTDMLRLFCEGKNEMEVAKEIADIYQVPLDYVSKDVTLFVGRLHKKGIL